MPPEEDVLEIKWEDSPLHAEIQPVSYWQVEYFKHPKNIQEQMVNLHASAALSLPTPPNMVIIVKEIDEHDSRI